MASPLEDTTLNLQEQEGAIMSKCEVKAKLASRNGTKFLKVGDTGLSELGSELTL